MQQREELDAGGQAFQELVEADDRLVGAKRAAERLEKRRGQFRQPFARFGRARGAIAAEMPGPDDPGDVARALEAEVGQRLERVGIVHVAREDEIADAGRKLRRRLEQRRILALHFLQRGAEGARELVSRAEAAHAGDALQPLVVLRQFVRLFVRHHLDGVLDVAQKTVLARQRVACVRADPAEFGQLAEHRDGLAPAQFGEPAAGDQLLGLNEELDLADAAASELDVVAAHGDLAVSLVGVDLALDGMHVGDRRVVHVLSPHEGLHLLQEGLGGFHIAGDRARLDHGRALPVLAPALVVGQGALDRDHERRRSGVGTQPEVGAEDVAVLCAIREDADEPPGQSREQVRRIERIADRRSFGIDEQDQVDVGGEVELARAELAHSEHDPARSRLRIITIRQGQLSLIVGLAEQEPDRGLDRGVGEFAEQVHGTKRARRSGEVGKGDQGMRLGLAGAQVGHQALFGDAIAHPAGADFGDDRFHPLVPSGVE